MGRRNNNISRHHRRPKSKGGSDDPLNIAKVSQKKHKAFHTLFGNADPHEIAEILNKDWIDPQYKFVVVKRNE